MLRQHSFVPPFRYADTEYQGIQTTLESRYEQLVEESLEPVFAWQDDGPLASPDLFDGFWTTWRDTDNYPLAVYGVSDACEDTGSFVCDEETAQVEEAKKAGSSSKKPASSSAPQDDGVVVETMLLSDYLPVSMLMSVGACMVLTLACAYNRGSIRSPMQSKATGVNRYFPL